MARYPAFLHAQDGTDFAVTFPDLPGLVACGTEPETALAAAQEALAMHLAALQEDRAVPAPRPLIGLAPPPGSVLVLIAGAAPKAPAIRVNVTIDKALLAEIDTAAAEEGMTRSGYLAEAARRMMRR